MVELTPAIREFLAAPRFAVLATIGAGGAPQQSVMWYELAGDEILMNTKRGRFKQRDIARDPRISLCVEDGYRFVALSGRITRTIDDQDVARADILRLGVRYDGRPEADRQMRELWSKQERITYFMTVEHVHAPGFERTS
jgi:PPOX class probable F420-dependent enzyme